MNNNKTILGTLLSVTAFLAAMGCWFCWHCPSRIYPPEAHGLFWRQLAWNGVGLTVFAGAWFAGWRRLLKAAPWLMSAWMVAIAAAQLSYPVRGVHKWLSLGPLRVNVAICFMPVFALFFAWLRDRKRLRPWMWWAALSLAAAWAVWHVAGDAGRMERLAAFFNPEDWMQDRAYMSRQLLAAFGASHWFGDAGKSLDFLPCPESDGMMSASALMFGKWFPTVLVGLFAVVGASLTLLWKGTGDAAKRIFAIFFGLWLTVPAVYCFFHSLALLPVAGMSPALAGYGGTAVVMTWFGTGILSAMVRKDASEGDCGTGTGIGVVTVLGICCVWIVITALGVGVLVLRCLVAEAEDLKFAEPRPRPCASAWATDSPPQGSRLHSHNATLANHGTLVRPVLIEGGACSCATNTAAQVVSPASADAIMRMLKSPIPSTVQMCEHDHETGRSVYSPTNYIASCAGYCPADSPQHVIVVAIVKPRTLHTGGEVARPVWDGIAHRMLLQKTN